MPSGGARAGAGRKRTADGTLRQMQKLNVEVKRDIEGFRNSLKHGFAEGISKLAQAFPSIMQRRIDAALAGDEKAADSLIALYARFLTPDIIAVSDDHPMADYARRIREEVRRAQLDLASGDIVIGEVRVIDDLVDNSGEGTPGSA